jgi:hypothetical protein
LRARAEEVLALAEVFENADACKKMRGIAVTYGKLAKRLERLAEVEKV